MSETNDQAATPNRLTVRAARAKIVAVLVAAASIAAGSAAADDSASVPRSL